MNMNDRINNRKLYTGEDEKTYYTSALHGMVCQNKDDPDILFKVKILGHYKRKYGWSEEEAWDFINAHLESSRGEQVGDTFFKFDWGSGYNKLVTPSDKMHEPTLDHRTPKSLFANEKDANAHTNFRIRSRRLNENKNNTNTDIERKATVLDNLYDMDEEYRKQFIIELAEMFN